MKAQGKNVLRALLIDDERLARRRMATLLDDHPELEIAGEAGDFEQALELLRITVPDVVFLDIALAPGNGFDLVPHLPSGTEVVFVTAYDNFAVRAFEANALDYLLKPVAPERLASTVERLRARADLPKTEDSVPGPAGRGRLAPDDPLLVRDGRTWRRMEAQSVAVIQAEGAYTRLLPADGDSFLVLRTLNQWNEMLPKEDFVRISRSILVNIRRIERLDTYSRNRADLFLTGQSVPVRLGRVASRQLRRALASEA